MSQTIAMSMLWKPYKWGGDDFSSFDCSGMVIEILKSVGVLPRNGDWTASGLWTLLENADCEVESPYKGCLVFWTNSKMQKIVHVEYYLGNGLCIGASGGGSKTKTKQDAINQNAYVKIRPYMSRKFIWGFMDPFKTPSKKQG